MRARGLAILVLVVSGLAGACGSVASSGTGTGGAGPGTTGGNPGTGGGETGGSPATGGAPATGGHGGGSAGTTGPAGHGGAGGIAGAAGGSAGGGSHAACVQASDCALHDDCCACASVPKAQAITTCNAECFASQCGTRGITAADVSCVAGRCVLARSCNTKNVACTIATPGCPDNQLPIVANGCYAGGCLPAEQCSEVASCDVCTAAGLACVEDQILPGPTFHCVTVPPACSAAPTCACLGSCTAGFQCVDPASTTPVCQCPTC